MFKKLVAGVVLALAFSASALAQSFGAGQVVPGANTVIKTDIFGNTFSSGPSGVGAADPCASNGVIKQATLINITTATTTQLVGLDGTARIFVCGFTFTIQQVVTTANTLRFVYGTGAACATNAVNITGDFGAGGVTAGVPILVATGTGNTVFTVPPGKALCATTAIGATAFFSGVLSYVQQ